MYVPKLLKLVGNNEVIATSAGLLFWPPILLLLLLLLLLLPRDATQSAVMPQYIVCPFRPSLCNVQVP